MKDLTNYQIELIAELFAKREVFLVEAFGPQWILSHAFQLGLKFGLEFTNESKDN